MSLQYSFADYHHQAISFLFSDEPVPLTKTGCSSSQDNNPIRYHFLRGSSGGVEGVWGLEPWWEGTPQPGPDLQQLLDAPSPGPGPQPRAQVSVTHLATGVAVVAPQGEGEIAAAVHAHHDVRDGHEGRGPLPQADPQPLPYLEQRSQAGSGVRRPAGPEPPVL